MNQFSVLGDMTDELCNSLTSSKISCKGLKWFCNSCLELVIKLLDGPKDTDNVIDTDKVNLI